MVRGTTRSFGNLERELMMLSVIPSLRYSECVSRLSLINGKTASESITLDFTERRRRSFSGTVKDDEVAAAAISPDGKLFVATESLSRCGGSLTNVGWASATVDDSLTTSAPSWRPP